ncbi:MAG: 23S rRNA (guanosine(2251)-2'-O)-methyltransferase RlmB [Firmicutes bacterium]|nr:23S rRNA (guanosine(2251)-2'-O)-methyltransferase RlmB [Bacillota bacterium]MBQ7241792.1 23S rRNA (guanosine(2251)-2'-O)-methyltransferase RlmB [Bacillota bacterium]MBR0104022.1 23S rRNA (guanosine(2251)-2'-O)-methyltransferase RlmB [Bacillota bacterium]
MERENFEKTKKEKKFNENQLEGRNAILEALKNGREIDKIFIRKGNTDGTLKKIVAMATDKGIVVQKIPPEKMDFMSQTKNHQGIIAYVSVHQYAEVADILNSAKEKGEDPFIIILDEITDTHNLGAIIRSAEASGVHGIIIPKRRSAGLNATVGKTSAGAVEYVPVAKVTNLASTIEDLKKEGLWIACADADGENYFESNLKGPIAVVIGNEGDGVSRLIKEKCDFIISIPMFGKISSLNASVAGGLIMYEIVRQRKFS